MLCRLITRFDLYICRYCSTTKVPTLLNFKSNLTDDQETKVLDVINNNTKDELSKYDVSRARIKNLEVWKNKKGSFKNLTDVLEVEGLGVKVLERLCKSIIKNEGFKGEILKDNAKEKSRSKTERSLLSPALNESQTSKIDLATGIYISANSISWAQIIKRNNVLNEWNFLDCSEYPKKMLPTETFTLAQELVKAIPPSDVYILEAGPNLSAVGQQQAISLMTYANQLELISMLLALINTSDRHNLDQTEKENCENKVYFLKSRVPARLFQTLVGYEKVSACSTVSNLLKHSQQNHLLPCTPVHINNELQEFYENNSSMHKDFLGQALILILAFMDLCVYKNPISLQNCSGSRKQKKAANA